MKKIALILVLLLAVGSVPGYCLTATVDGFLERREKSDIGPVRDSAKIASAVNRGVDASLGYADPVLKHRKHITDPVMKGSKTIINTTWDMIGKLNPFRYMHKEPKTE